MNKKLVYVIVLNYNGKKHLEYCLPSLLQTDYENYKIVLVDNNSSDDSINYVKENFPQIEVMNTGENKGWAGGNNFGVKYAKQQGAEYVVLANNDIMVHPLWIKSAVMAFESDKKVGFVGCRVFGEVKKEPVKDYYKACENFDKIAFEYTSEFISGMALFVRSSVFDTIGEIDEIFFAYSEESDFEIRGKKAGYKRIVTNVPIWHYSSGSFEKAKIKASYLTIRNEIRLYIKHTNLFKVLWRISYIYMVGCNPLFKRNRKDGIITRLRPRGVFFNFFLISYCILWNVLHLCETLKIKREDYLLINKAIIKKVQDNLTSELH